MRTYLAAKIRWLSRRHDIEHLVVLPADRDGYEQAQGATVYRLKGPPAPGSPGYRVLWNAARLRRILLDERPHIVELGSVYTAPWLLRWAIRRGRRPRIVGFVHMDVIGAVERHVAAWRLGTADAATRLAGGYVRRAYGFCDALVATSRTARSQVLRAGLPAPAVVPMGVDLERFRPEHADATWRREMRIPFGGPIGLYVGRLAAEKDLGVLLAALPDLHRQTGLTVVAVGEGRMRARLEAIEREHPELLRVVGFETRRDRLARAYASADVLFAPCPHETFGLAVLEAAACGLPAVGAGRGAVGELLTDAPWGRTFTPGDPESLVDATMDVLSRDRDVAGLSARRTAEQYTWDRTFTRLMEIYRELAR